MPNVPPARRSHSGVKETCKPLSSQERTKAPTGPPWGDRGPSSRRVRGLRGRGERFSVERGYIRQRWDGAGVRGGKTVLHLETERQAVGLGPGTPECRDLAQFSRCLIFGPRTMTSTQSDSLNICGVNECWERLSRGYDCLLTCKLDLDSQGLLSPSPGPWNTCPACLHGPRSCSKDTALRWKGDPETTWTVYATEPS